jgi:hypothetical protein
MSCNILLQTGDRLLKQDGDALLLTNCVVGGVVDVLEYVGLVVNVGRMMGR